MTDPAKIFEEAVDRLRKYSQSIAFERELGKLQAADQYVEALYKEGYLQGRANEVQILGATDGCTCLTCQEVRYKLRKQLKLAATDATTEARDE
jgi:hypothetical protein